MHVALPIRRAAGRKTLLRSTEVLLLLTAVALWASVISGASLWRPGPYPLDGEWRDWALFLSKDVAWAALVTAGIWLLWRLVRSVRMPEGPFTAANTRRLVALALLVGLGGSLLGPAWSLFAEPLLTPTSRAANEITMSRIPGVFPALTGVLLAVLALVWSQGVRMRQDVDGLV
ncbi:Protein of unknown function (DUF2975) [Kineococcus xinjiangensis]|uniref:DUF2975 family protein n=1 Tax=Kineococcus xinjiangensis TaxID=512762 RepID=A0A2S6ID48_9ACTN|nr:DUF2975 domain-containing protein [Kineococcus xinjiangensis]PPK92131.1 Protein of unknown function (DUF2975) [Kineococcus xinjiangensis]